MLSMFNKALSDRRNLKKIKKVSSFLTASLDCFNIFVRAGLKGVKLYNNTDIIAELSWSELDSMLNLGDLFSMIAVYTLCEKYSINYFW